MFKINNEWWYIKFVSPLHPMLQRENGLFTIGMCNNKDKTIYLSNQLYGFKLRKVLCHEITHAAMFSYNVNLTLEQEELLADIIATYGDEIINITNKVFSKIKRG